MNRLTAGVLGSAIVLGALVAVAPLQAHQNEVCGSEAYDWRDAARVEVYSWDSIVLDGSAIPLSQIRDSLARSGSNQTGVLVVTGGEVPDQRLLTVLDQLTESGMVVWGIESPTGRSVSNTAYVLAGGRAVLGGIGMKLTQAGECIRATTRPGDGLHVLSTPGSAYGDGGRVVADALAAGLIPSVAGNVTEDVTKGGVLNERDEVDSLARAAEFYQGMDPGMAVRHIVHASLMSDTTLAALLQKLPDEESEEIFKRLPPVTALRVSDIARRYTGQ